MRKKPILGGISLTLAIVGWASLSQAADSLKIGMILPMSGPYAAYGKQIGNGARLFLDQAGGEIAGRKVQLIVKDDTGVAPEISKRAAQELVIKDKVDVLAGFALSPSAFAVAPVATEAKKPMIVMNAASSAITAKSDYILRVSHTLPQITAPVAEWAARNRIRTAYVLVADFTPGHDAETQFRKSFAAAGGEIVGGVRTPVKTTDFAPFLQKIKDIRPDAVFLFVPPGEQTVSFVKGFTGRGLAAAGISIVATGDLTEEDVIDAVGDDALGIVTSLQYSEVHDSPENKAYTSAYAKAYPRQRPNYMSVSGYDGLQLIAKTLEKTGGDATGDKFIAAARGLSWISPRGRIAIDAETRDIVQTIYLRKVERVDGKLQNVEFDEMVDMKDPGKQ